MRVFFSVLCPWILCLGVASCDSSLPRRELPAGDCFATSDCADSTQVCRNHQCVGCSEHSECTSQVCDTYGDLPGGGAGKCLPATGIIYVDSKDSNPACDLGMTSPTGTQGEPLCNISDALDRVKSESNKLIRVLASPNAYSLRELTAASGSVILIGPGYQPGNGATLIIDDEALPDAFRFTGANAVIDGFRFGGPKLVGSGGKVTIRRSKLDYLEYGIRFENNCNVTLDRNVFSENTLGLTFDGCTINVTNSVLLQNNVDIGVNLVNFIGGSGIFAFNTVAYNVNMSTAPIPPIVNCMSSNVTLKNSIFVHNGSMQELASGCRTAASSIAVGKGDMSSGQIKQDVVFVDSASGDLRLAGKDASNQQYFIDKAVEVSASDKNSDHDFAGVKRPQGAGHDIGAYEVVVDAAQ